MEIAMGEHASVIYGSHFPNRIFVGCLPSQVTAAVLGKYFKNFGEVIESKVVLDSYKKSKRFGFVTFAKSDDVQQVLNRGDFFMLGKRIVVGPAVKKISNEKVPDVPVKIFMAEDVGSPGSSNSNNRQRFVYRNMAPSEQEYFTPYQPPFQPSFQPSSQCVYYSTYPGFQYQDCAPRYQDFLPHDANYQYQEYTTCTPPPPYHQEFFPRFDCTPVPMYI